MLLFDYGVGNMHSLQKALEKVGAQPVIASDEASLLAAQRIVLPGVGAFGPASQQLAPYIGILRDKLEAGTPVLGICLGMQLLFEGSAESPGRGIGWMQGAVSKLQHDVVPAIGWNEVTSADPLLESGDYYFVHSYAADVGPDTIATSHYGKPFGAAVRKGSAIGVQFHPEKSSTLGLAFLRRWACS